MAAAAWATDLTDIILDPTTSSGWTALGGGASGLPSGGETDFYIQGGGTPSCMSKAAWTNNVKGFMYTGGGPWTIPTDGVLLGWMLYAPAVASLATKTNGGMRSVIGSSSTAYYSYYFGGSDTLIFDSWIPVGIDANNATADATVGSPSGTESVFGVVANLPTTAGPTKGNPIGLDALRYGRHTITYTNGDGADPDNSFSLAEATANSLANRWGNIELINGAYYVQGFHSFGSGGTLCVFTDSNKTVFIRACAHNLTNDAVSTAYNRFEIINASTVVTWDNIIFQSLGTRSRGTFVVTTGTLTATSCQFVDVNTFTLLSSSTMTDCIFRRTNAITAPGSTLNGSQILAPTVAANASGLVWDVATDPDGKLDDMIFTKGTNNHHAIEFGANIPSTITLRGCDFTGFSASQNNDASIFHFKDTTGTITLNLVGCSSDVSFATSYRTDGATIVVVQDPVTFQVTVKDLDTGSAIENARVLVPVTSGVNFPYQASVTIASTGTTATVTHTTHGLATNDNVLIEGANEDEYNGAFQITVTGTNTYTYTMNGDPVDTATGTITSTMVLLNGLTNASGIITDSRTYSGNQTVNGWARKATGSPLYRQAPVTDTVNSTSGLLVTVFLQPDE